MRVQSEWPIIRVLVSAMLVLLACTQVQAGKPGKPLSASIEIAAPPKTVYEAIQKTRDSVEMHRKLLSYDGRLARIKENLENVPIYGDVECIWEETEIPFERIDYTMVSSDKFKSGSGSWILTPSVDHKSTTLELQSYLDTGLHLPFAGEITKMGAAKDNKIRLQRIKQVAEGIKTETKDRGDSPEKN
jgi:hypothetical protein